MFDGSGRSPRGDAWPACHPQGAELPSASFEEGFHVEETLDHHDPAVEPGGRTQHHRGGEADGELVPTNVQPLAGEGDEVSDALASHPEHEAAPLRYPQEPVPGEEPRDGVDSHAFVPMQGRDHVRNRRVEGVTVVDRYLGATEPEREVDRYHLLSRPPFEARRVVLRVRCSPIGGVGSSCAMPGLNLT